MYKVVELEQTCWACPSQWEGKLDDGRMIYIRYRSGLLSVDVSPEPTNNLDGLTDWDRVFFKRIGDMLDGLINYLEVKKELKGVVEF